MNNLQMVVKDDTRIAMHVAVELCENGDFDSIGQAFRWLMQETREPESMLLPMDADGLPIHIGDMLECNANGYKGAFTVFAIGNDTVVGNHDIEWIRDNPDKWFHVASYCRHYYNHD